MTPYFAVGNEHKPVLPDIIQLFIEKGATIKADNGDSLQHSATRNESNYSLDSGLLANVVGNSRWTRLHYAVLNKHI